MERGEGGVNVSNIVPQYKCSDIFHWTLCHRSAQIQLWVNQWYPGQTSSSTSLVFICAGLDITLDEDAMKLRRFPYYIIKLLPSWKSCWTNSWVAGGLIYRDAHVTSKYRKPGWLWKLEWLMTNEVAFHLMIVPRHNIIIWLFFNVKVIPSVLLQAWELKLLAFT